ncbi:MAG: hypothetical protein ACRCVU_09175 [Flavobacterium sp.]
MAKKTNGNKIYVTFTVDEDVKKRFNIACATLDMNMSEVVQAMMENFLDVSKKMADLESERLRTLKENEVKVEVVMPTGRLEEE